MIATLINTMACMAVLGMLVCRLNRTTADTQARVRSQMVWLTAGIAAHGFLPWAGLGGGGVGGLCITTAVGAFLWLGRHRWSAGAPPGTRTDWPPLDEAHPTNPAPERGSVFLDR